MPNMIKAQEIVAEVEAALAKLKAILAENEEDSLERIKKLLASDQWPLCANENLICDTENETLKCQRGQGIVELMVEGELEDKKFLDFGCGEGHCASYVSSKKASMSIGYDINPNNWSNKSSSNLCLTSNWKEVVDKGKYDTILMFDVLDHLAGEGPAEALGKAKSVLSDTGTMYVRVHPFTSRHALHNYHDLNKGFIHLVFSPDELKGILKGVSYIEHTSKVVTPLISYDKFFEQAGLKVIERRPINDIVEPFFKEPEISDRIKKNSNFATFPEFQMSMAFIDYVLSKNP